jgi:hypothetical protein
LDIHTEEERDMSIEDDIQWPSSPSFEARWSDECWNGKALNDTLANAFEFRFRHVAEPHVNGELAEYGGEGFSVEVDEATSLACARKLVVALAQNAWIDSGTC